MSRTRRFRPCLAAMALRSFRDLYDLSEWRSDSSTSTSTNPSAVALTLRYRRPVPTDYELLRPYLPIALLRLLERKRTRVQTHAIALFVDVSGFTPLTEAFAALGNAGAEELTGIINQFFEALIAVIQTHTGDADADADIVGFGGDAMSVIFACRPSRTAATAKRAWQCAIALQQAAAQFAQTETSVGTFPLAVKVGLGRGTFMGEVVGDPARDARFLAYGNALAFANAAEHEARAGEVIAHASLAAWLPPAASSSTASANALAPKKLAAPAIDKHSVHLLHPALAQRVLARSAFVNEHRLVTIVFAAFNTARELGLAMQMVQQWDGCVARLDTSGGTLRMLALFGAPIAHEDDEARALHCALALRERLAHARAGICTGFVFCGDVGSAARREYTVMGDAVNLAARLLQAAQPGQIIASESTTRPTIPAARFVWQLLPLLKVKGKAEPVQARLLQAGTTASNASEPSHARAAYVGRADELARIQTSLHAALQGHGNIVQLVAEAGLGKSRLAQEIMQWAAQAGFEVHLSAGQPYGQAAYAAWRSLLRSVMGLAQVETGLDTRRAAQSWLAAHHLNEPAQWPAQWPLLAGVLGLPADGDGTTTWLQQLDPATRQHMLHAACWACLQHTARQQPLLLVLDDAHWLDPASMALLRFVCAQAAQVPLAVLVLQRPPTLVLDRAQTLHLSELGPTDAHALALQAWQRQFGEWPPEPTAEAIAQRAQGNPFFIEQLVSFAKQRGRFDPHEVPDTLRSLLLSRIDQLTLEAQTVLKVASVIGPQLNVAWVQACWPDASSINPDQIEAELDHLIRLDLLQSEATTAWATHTFRHATVREVAYESLSFATRAALHEKAGFAIEHEAIAETTFLELLAHHFGHSKNTAQQRLYFRKAGDAAKDNFANEAALAHFERLLKVLPASEFAASRSQALVQLGSVQEHVGEWRRAEQSYRQSLTTAQTAHAPRETAHSLRALGALLSRQQSHAAAVRWLTQAAETFTALGDDEGLCRTLSYLSFAQLELGRLEAAGQLAQRELEIATRNRDVTGQCDALQVLGQISLQLGRFDEAHDRLNQAHQLATAHHDVIGEILIGNDLALLHWRKGQVDGALDQLTTALAVARRIGYSVWVCILTNNLGDLCRELGWLSEAEPCIAEALALALQLGDQANLLTSLGNAAYLLRDQHQLDAAEAILRDAVLLGRQLQMPAQQSEHLQALAELGLTRGETTEALVHLQAAKALALESGNHEVAFRSQVLGILARHILGEVGMRVAEKSLRQLLRNTHEIAEEALIYDTLWQMGQRPDDQRKAVERYGALYQQLPRQYFAKRVRALMPADLERAEDAPLEPVRFSARNVSREKVVDLRTLLAQAHAHIQHSVKDVPH